MKHCFPFRFVGRVRVCGALIMVAGLGAREGALEHDASVVATTVCTEVLVVKESLLDDATPNASILLEDGGVAGDSVDGVARMSLDEEEAVVDFSRARLRSYCCRRRGAHPAPNMSVSVFRDEFEASCNFCTRAGSCIPR